MKPAIRTAEEKDVEPIHKLIMHYASKGVILERSIDDIKNNLGSFLVAELNGVITGTVTHYDYGENLKEVRSLAVTESARGHGIGRELLLQLIRNIKSKSDAKIFTLTYKPGFFSRNGFVVVSKSEFPEKIWKDCLNCKDRDNCGETALVYQG